MFETVTVDQAIRRGKLMVNNGVFLILFGGIGLVSFLCIKNYVHPVMWIIGLPLSFVFAWLYWSFMITRWRLWAFENVRNTHELKRRAIEAQLIWPDGKFFEKTEIRTKAQKQQWAELQKKFISRDVYVQDYTLPPEMVIKNSRQAVIIALVFGVAAIGMGIYDYFDKSYLYAASLVAGGILLTCIAIKRGMDRSTQLIINNKGIQVKKVGFTPWAHITNEQVITYKKHRSAATYLEYTTPRGNVKINIDYWNVPKVKLQEMLQTYRIRSEKTRMNNRETSLSRVN